MICGKCGREISDDALYCNYCGMKASVEFHLDEELEKRKRGLDSGRTGRQDDGNNGGYDEDPRGRYDDEYDDEDGYDEDPRDRYDDEYDDEDGYDEDPRDRYDDEYDDEDEYDEDPRDRYDDEYDDDGDYDDERDERYRRGSRTASERRRREEEIHRKDLRKVRALAGIVAAVLVIAAIGGYYLTNRLLSPKRARENMKKGEQYLEAQDYEAAAKAYGKAVEMDPSNSDAYTGLGGVYAAQAADTQKDNKAEAQTTLKKAEQAYRSAIYKENSNARAWEGLGRVQAQQAQYVRQTDPLQAQQYYQEAIQSYETLRAIDVRQENTDAQKELDELRRQLAELEKQYQELQQQSASAAPGPGVSQEPANTQEAAQPPKQDQGQPQQNAQPAGAEQPAETNSDDAGQQVAQQGGEAQPAEADTGDAGQQEVQQGGEAQPAEADSGEAEQQEVQQGSEAQPAETDTGEAEQQEVQQDGEAQPAAADSGEAEQQDAQEDSEELTETSSVSEEEEPLEIREAPASLPEKIVYTSPYGMSEMYFSYDGAERSLAISGGDPDLLGLVPSGKLTEYSFWPAACSLADRQKTEYILASIPWIQDETVMKLSLDSQTWELKSDDQGRLVRGIVQENGESRKIWWIYDGSGLLTDVVSESGGSTPEEAREFLKNAGDASESGTTDLHIEYSGGVPVYISGDEQIQITYSGDGLSATAWNELTGSTTTVWAGEYGGPGHAETDGQAVDFVYDTAGRLVRIVRGGQGDAAEKTEYIYSDSVIPETVEEEPDQPEEQPEEQLEQTEEMQEEVYYEEDPGLNPEDGSEYYVEQGEDPGSEFYGEQGEETGIEYSEEGMESF